MKISTLESIGLLAFSIVCDLINIALVILVVGLIVNTLVNVFLGAIFILWFSIRSHLMESEDQEGSDPTEKYLEDEKDRLKKLYDRSQNERKSVGAEVSTSADDISGSGTSQITERGAERVAGRETEQLAERGVASTAERVATETGERVATQIAERTTAQTVERVAVQTSEKAAAGIIGRILGATFFAKLIPFLNFLPLWTISTVLLLRQNKKEQEEIEDEKNLN